MYARKLTVTPEIKVFHQMQQLGVVMEEFFSLGQPFSTKLRAFGESVKVCTFQGIADEYINGLIEPGTSFVVRLDAYVGKAHRIFNAIVEAKPTISGGTIRAALDTVADEMIYWAGFSLYELAELDTVVGMFEPA